jgi:hypothetical protein
MQTSVGFHSDIHLTGEIMSTREKQACPLCASPATYASFDFDKRKAFECEFCGQYVLASIAERMLSPALGNKERQLSEYVKRNQMDPQSIPEISTENAPSGGKQVVIQILRRATLRLP